MKLDPFIFQREMQKIVNQMASAPDREHFTRWYKAKHNGKWRLFDIFIYELDISTGECLFNNDEPLLDPVAPIGEYGFYRHAIYAIGSGVNERHMEFFAECLKITKQIELKEINHIIDTKTVRDQFEFMRDVFPMFMVGQELL